MIPPHFGDFLLHVRRYPWAAPASRLILFTCVSPNTRHEQADRLKEALAGQDDFFEFVNCESLYYKWFRLDQVRMRVESLLNEAVKKKYREHVQRTGQRDVAVRAFIRWKLTSKTHEEDTFYKYKNHFLMIDRYPEIATRFPFTYAEPKETIVVEGPLTADGQE